MTLDQAESFAKVKGFIQRLAELRDYCETFTKGDKALLDGFIDFYSLQYNILQDDKGNKMKYWISKYALTRGIFEIEGIHDDFGNSLQYKDNTGWLGFYYKGEYHETEAAARSAAEEMRTKKIASLRKQIEKLERMEF